MDRCPLALIRHPFTQQALELFAAWKEGILPVAGGLRDQPALYRRVMSRLSSLDEEAREWYEAEKTPNPPEDEES